MLASACSRRAYEACTKNTPIVKPEHLSPALTNNNEIGFHFSTLRRMIGGHVTMKVSSTAINGIILLQSAIEKSCSN